MITAGHLTFSVAPCPGILFLSGQNVRTRNRLAISHVQLLSTQLAPHKLVNFSWSSPSYGCFI